MPTSWTDTVIDVPAIADGKSIYVTDDNGEVSLLVAASEPTTPETVQKLHLHGGHICFDYAEGTVEDTRKVQVFNRAWGNGRRLHIGEVKDSGPCLALPNWADWFYTCIDMRVMTWDGEFSELSDQLCFMGSDI